MRPRTVRLLILLVAVTLVAAVQAGELAETTIGPETAADIGWTGPPPSAGT